MPENTPNAQSCDSEHYPVPNTIGLLGDKGPCWWSAQWGFIPPTTPNLGYGGTAILSSKMGPITCRMEYTGVTCTTEDEQTGWFASKQAFLYLSNGRWSPQAP
ncbi:hypothetical protein [Gordonia phthalatica]|nr:hypothetical protein [Gordonia phthalatica]